MRVNEDELKRHHTKEDAWTVLGGRVYNITPYLEYHPGGVVQLMRVAGKDGTQLFVRTHAWVNFEHMLDKCLVGIYVRD
jgi:cytochrome b involved in lipid metabolism